MLIGTSYSYGAFKPECTSIQNEIDIFKNVSPAGLSIYQDRFNECKIYQINGLSINDYFNSEVDTLLALSFIAIDQKVTHPRLLSYLIDNSRWDLLLKTLDTIRDYNRQIQINAINYLFYRDIPYYFNAEIKQIFNFFSAPEKIAVSQQLIPSNPSEIKHLLKRNNYIYDFWPMFDQLVYISHLRELFPFQFEQFSQFWREKLVSYYYDDIENQNQSFKILSYILNQEVVRKEVPGANPSFQMYYFIKIKAFDLATDVYTKNGKQLFFDNLRYFQMLDSQQQDYLLNLPVEFSITDIKRLFNSYFFQLNDPTIQTWIWKIAVDNSFDCEENLINPNRFLSKIPAEFDQYIKLFSPIKYTISKTKWKVDHFFINDPTNTEFKSPMSKETISKLTRFYNDFKALPFKQREKVINSIFPFIEIKTHQEYFNLIPYLSMEQQFDLIERFSFLETIPTRNRAYWNRYVQSNLHNIYVKNFPPVKVKKKKDIQPPNKYLEFRKRANTLLR